MYFFPLKHTVYHDPDRLCETRTTYVNGRDSMLMVEFRRKQQNNNNNNDLLSK